MIEQLHELRSEIDKVDAELLALCALRFKIVHNIKKIKKQLSLNAFDHNRFQELMQDRLLKAEQVGLCSEFVKNLFHVIHEESLRLQLSCSHAEKN